MNYRIRSWRAWHERGPSVVVPRFRPPPAPRARRATGASVPNEQKDVRKVPDAVDTEHVEQPNDKQSDCGLEKHLASGAQPGRSKKAIARLQMSVVRARCPSDESAGGIESTAGADRKRIRGSHRAAPRRSGTIVASRTTHERRVSGPLTGPATIESSWSRDHEDGGPTIQLPAASSAAPFAFELRSVYRAVS